MAATVRATSPAEAEAAVAAIVLAFAADPAARWSFPDPAVYLARFPAVVRAFGGRAFAAGTAFHVENFAGAALWLPPGTGPDEEALMGIFGEAVPPDLQEEVFSVFEQMGAFHPAEPHWYLPLIGVDPARRGQGHGAALLRHALADCDRDHVPAYLESSNPSGIPLYERHGFVALGRIQAGSSPPIVPMLRQAR